MFARIKSFFYRRKAEIIGSIVQILLCIIFVTYSFPLLKSAVDVINKANPEIMPVIGEQVIEAIPGGEALLNIFTVANAENALIYISDLMNSVGEYGAQFFYIGGCMCASQLLFQELWVKRVPKKIRRKGKEFTVKERKPVIPGIPLLQHLLGFFFGMLTMFMIKDVFLTAAAALFLILLNIILILLTGKPVWKKILDILLLQFGFQCVIAFLTEMVMVISIAVIHLGVKLTPRSIFAYAIVIVLWACCMLTKYWLEKKVESSEREIVFQMDNLGQ